MQSAPSLNITFWNRRKHILAFRADNISLSYHTATVLVSFCPSLFRSIFHSLEILAQISKLLKERYNSQTESIDSGSYLLLHLFMLIISGCLFLFRVMTGLTVTSFEDFKDARLYLLSELFTIHLMYPSQSTTKHPLTVAMS